MNREICAMKHRREDKMLKKDFEFFSFFLNLVFYIKSIFKIFGVD